MPLFEIAIILPAELFSYLSIEKVPGGSSCGLRLRAKDGAGATTIFFSLLGSEKIGIERKVTGEGFDAAFYL